MKNLITKILKNCTTKCAEKCNNQQYCKSAFKVRYKPRVVSEKMDITF